jgi:hypothetical protein
MYHLADRASKYLIPIEEYYLGSEGGWEKWFRDQGLNETWAYLLAWGIALTSSLALPFLVRT